MLALICLLNLVCYFLNVVTLYITITMFDNIDMVTYNLNIKKERVKKRLTQKELAQKIGVSRSYLSDLENCKFDIKLSLLIKITEILEVGLNDLIEIDSTKKIF